jgi:hypothetical protein
VSLIAGISSSTNENKRRWTFLLGVTTLIARGSSFQQFWLTEIVYFGSMAFLGNAYYNS